MAFINVYLNYNGNCEAAFNHYKSVFGGEFADFSRFSDMPSEEPMPASEAKKVLHVALPVGSAGCVLMGSDCPPEFADGKPGNLFNVSVSADSKEEADKIFKGLAEGGHVSMPIADTFWGAYFGMLSDKFGVQWMVNYDYPKS
jgi:PhnB protein